MTGAGNWLSTRLTRLYFSVKRAANCRRARDITRDRGALAHDDRIDALAGAVALFQRAMMMDVDQAAKAIKDAEIEDFLEGFDQPSYRGIGQWGSGGNLEQPKGHEWAVEANQLQHLA